MQNNNSVKPERNWFLVFMSVLLIITGCTLVFISLTNIATFGWWSALIAAGGFATIAASVMSIVKNDPSWILLNLIIPG